MHGRAVTVRLPASGQPAVGMRGTLCVLIAVVLGVLLAAPSAGWAGGSLYASNWTQGAVSMFSLDAGGLPAQQGAGITSTGSQPAGLSIAPNGQDLYVANRNQGTVSTFSIGAGGALTQVGPPVLSGDSNSITNSGPYGVAVSPNGQNLYVANYLSGTVSTFSIGAGGLLTQQGTGITSGSSGPGWVAVSPGGQNLYVTNYDAGTVSTFSIGAGGALSPAGSPVSTGSGTRSQPENLAIAPSGEHLYVANRADGTVSTFSIGAGGALTTQGSPMLSGTSVTSGPGGVAVSPNGQNLYVTNQSEGTVSAFSIGDGGALTALGTTPPLGAQPFGAAVSPGGQALYVANFALGTVSTFSIGAGGAITPLGSVVSGSGSDSGPYQLAAAPNQGPTAVYGASVSPIEQAGTFSAQPSLAGSAPIATYAWQFSDGARATGALVSHTFPAPGTYTVTLTLTDADSCSTFGPFTGQTANCTLDPAASTSHAITVPAPPSASRASITGIAKGKPKLAFTVAAGPLAPSLATISVNLPRGLTFSSRRHNLARYIVVNGQHAKFAARVSHGVLIITLGSAQTSAQVTIAGPELSASKRLVNVLRSGKAARRGRRHKPAKRHKPVKRHKAVKLTLKLKLTDAARDVVPLVIKATAR